MEDMRDSSITLTGFAVEDELHLDGSRHLIVELVDSSDDWSCSLSLVLEKGGNLVEGTFEMDYLGAVRSAVLEDVLSLRHEPFLMLTANFIDTDTPKNKRGRGWVLQLSHKPEFFDRERDFEVIATSSQ